MGAPAKELLYESGREARVRLLTWGGALLLGLTAWAGWWVYGNLVVGDGGGQPAPPGARLLAGAAIAALGALPLAGMLVYRRYYVVRLLHDKGGERLEVETLGLWGPRVRPVELARVGGAAYHRGKLDLPGQVAVDAPWHWVRVEGGRGLLLDGKGRFADNGLVRRILESAAG